MAYAMYSVQCTQYSIHYTVYTIQYTLYTIEYIYEHHALYRCRKYSVHLQCTPTMYTVYIENTAKTVCISCNIAIYLVQYR